MVDGPVDIVLHVFLPAPGDLHGALDLGGDPHRQLDHVDFQPPAKAAANEVIVYGHLLER